MTESAARRSHGPELLLAEGALSLVTLAVVAGFARVFDGDWFPQLAAVAVAAHLAAAATRRRGWSVPLGALAVAAVTAVALAWLLFPGTTVLGVPMPGTVDAAADALRAAWTSFRDVVAPAPVEPGFLLAAGVAVAFSAFLADWAAFRLWSPFEAVVPATTLFIFCSLLGGEQHQVRSAAVFAGTVVAFLLAHRVARQVTTGSWVTEEVRRGSRALLASGAALGTVAVLAGAVAGPRLPGADDDAVVSWRGEAARTGQRVTISPLVDIRSRLVDQSDVVVFEVEATERAYWRLTALDSFEDGIWKSSGRYTSVNGDLPGEPVATEGAVPAEQVFAIRALAALWLPAAFQPYEVESPTDVRYHEGSSTLIVDTDVADSDDLVYRVRSSLPRYTPEQLRSASTEVPPDIAEQYLALPPDTSAVAAQTAEAWTAGLSTPYDQARALQDRFQAEFAYDLEVPAGHSADAIDSFLSVRRGYCEQFAGTFAVMARQLGIPARVAVGFTPGEQSTVDGRRYTVRGEHAHAWPEVWLGEYGWVAFEPTPGRGAPGAESYTGLPEAQDTSGPETAPTTQTTVPTTVAPGQPGEVAPSTSTTVPGEVAAPPLTLGGGDEPDDGPGALTIAALAVLLAGVAYLATVPAALWAQQRHRRRRATTSPARVRLAWQESTDALATIRLGPSAHETAHELASRVASALPEVADDLARLADDVDAACFAPSGGDRDAAPAAERTRDAVRAAVAARQGTRQRLAAHLDARRLRGRHRGGARHVVGPRGAAPAPRVLSGSRSGSSS